MPPDTDAAVVALGDMPLVTPDAVRRLIAAYSPAEHRSICVPVFSGERGNPVLWGRQHFEALKPSPATGVRARCSISMRMNSSRWRCRMMRC